MTAIKIEFGGKIYVGDVVEQTAPTPIPPDPTLPILSWASMDNTQHVDGSTSVLSSFAGRADVLKCVCNKVGSTSPTKANREKHFPVVNEGRTIKSGFDVVVMDRDANGVALDINGYRTWLDCESLTDPDNEGWRLSDKLLNLTFNRKFSDGANLPSPVPAGTPKLQISSGTNFIWNKIETETLMHRTNGRCIIKLNGIIVVNYSGPTMVSNSAPARNQYGIANTSKIAGLVAYYDDPWFIIP